MIERRMIYDLSNTIDGSDDRNSSESHVGVMVIESGSALCLFKALEFIIIIYTSLAAEL